MKGFFRVGVAVVASALVATSGAGVARAAVVHAASDTVTFTSAQVGSSGSTPQFYEAGNWRMAWSYDCSAFGSPGNFIVNINQAANGYSLDTGPNELGSSGSGTDFYYDSGTFSLSVDSECAWTITVSPSGAVPSANAASFSSSATGSSGQTSQFSMSGPWTMTWSYNCASFGSSGNFIVDVKQPPGDLSNDTGPNELGTAGSGQDTYYDPGVFSLDVTSECAWSIKVAAIATPAHCSTRLPSGTVVGMAVTSDGRGYWIASSTGRISACGDATSFGDGPPGTAAIATAPHGNGYWLVTGSGLVEAFGSATNYGDLAGVNLSKPIVAMAGDPATGGYWLLGGDGGVFSFHAPFYGSTGNIRLAKPAVGMAATPKGTGYYFVASDGGIFAFHAPFYGSTGNIALAKPVVGMAIDLVTGGYWMDASDGGIFAFHAPFYGSTGNLALAQPCVGMTAMPNGSGYRFVAADGGIFSFHAPFEGSAA